MLRRDEKTILQDTQWLLLVSVVEVSEVFAKNRDASAPSSRATTIRPSHLIAWKNRQHLLAFANRFSVATNFSCRQSINVGHYVSGLLYMSQHEKLLERLKSRPADFTWGELVTMLGSFGYSEESGSGSRRRFVHERTGVVISLHEPHPRHVLKHYQVQLVLSHLKEEGHI